MNEETYQSLKEVIAFVHQELNKVKKVSNKYHMLVTLNNVEGWVNEVAKDYDQQT